MFDQGVRNKEDKTDATAASETMEAATLSELLALLLINFLVLTKFKDFFTNLKLRKFKSNYKAEISETPLSNTQSQEPEVVEPDLKMAKMKMTMERKTKLPKWLVKQQKLKLCMNLKIILNKKVDFLLYTLFQCPNLI